MIRALIVVSLALYAGWWTGTSCGSGPVRACLISRMESLANRVHSAFPRLAETGTTAPASAVEATRSAAPTEVTLRPAYDEGFARLVEQALKEPVGMLYGDRDVRWADLGNSKTPAPVPPGPERSAAHPSVAVDLHGMLDGPVEPASRATGVAGEPVKFDLDRARRSLKDVIGQDPSAPGAYR